MVGLDAFAVWIANLNGSTHCPNYRPSLDKKFIVFVSSVTNLWGGPLIPCFIAVSEVTNFGICMFSLETVKITSLNVLLMNP